MSKLECCRKTCLMSLDAYRLRHLCLCISNSSYGDPMTDTRKCEQKVSLLFPLFQVFFQCWRPANWADFVFGAWLRPQSSHWAWITARCGLLPWTVPYRQGWLCRYLAGSGFTRYQLFKSHSGSSVGFLARTLSVWSFLITVKIIWVLLCDRTWAQLQ